MRAGASCPGRVHAPPPTLSPATLSPPLPQRRPPPHLHPRGFPPILLIPVTDPSPGARSEREDVTGVCGHSRVVPACKGGKGG
jgi:hypothetical protein